MKFQAPIYSRKTALTCFIAASLATVFSGCSKEPQAVPTKAPVAAAAPAAAPTKSDSLPAECDAYIRTVTACVEKVGASNPAIASFKQQMDTNRAEWAKVADKTTFAAACKQMEDSFKATAAPALKC
jgi:hypothetical protein